MPRRITAALTIMYAAGITAGCICFERIRPAEALGFLAASGIALLFAGGDMHEHLRTRLILIAVMLSGFASFAVSFAFLESEMPRYTEETRLCGRVVSAAVKDDTLKLTVKRRRGAKGPRKTQLILRNYSANPATDPYGKTEFPEAYMLIGADIEAGGEYREPLAADDPGCFDNRMYLRARGIALAFRANGIDVTDPGSGMTARFMRYLFMTREGFIDCFDDETAGFIRGVVFGDKRDMDEDLINEFNANSTGHILAVSGLHMGFMYSLLRVLSGRRKTIFVSVAIIAVMIIYGSMTLWSSATVRACIVMGISIMSIHFRRPFDLLTSVSTAALLLLIRQPYQLFDTGFQMSFLAMAGIAFFTKPLSSVTGEALGVMLAVQAGTMPVTAYTFYRINPLAVFINIPVILITSLLVPLCIIMLMCGLALGIFPEAGLRLSELMAYSVMKINHLLAFDGGFSYSIAGFGASAAVMMYVLAFGMSSEWARIKLIRKERKSLLRTGAVLMMPMIMLSAGLYDTFADDEIVFVSVGQGDCTHIRAGGHDILIDGGGREDFDTGKRVLMPYLLHGGCDALDTALVTHLHEDHCKGISELSAVFPVGKTGIPADYREVLRDGGDEKIRFDPGQLYPVGPDTRISVADDVFIDVIWPVRTSAAGVSADDPNEHNTVYMISYKGVKVMVTGDLLEEDELEMVEYYNRRGRADALDCDILKVAHHGSRSSSSEVFLDAASPFIAVIQAGRNNIYGHPHRQTLERLEQRGINIYRTDLNGAVGIDIRRKKLKVDVFRRADQTCE